MFTKKKIRKLGVNIDHIATLRQARHSPYPDPVDSLDVLKKCHVDQVTVHLREDRRHIQDRDLIEICKADVLPVNMELAVTAEMIAIASRIRPHTCTFVPERRLEITTEGGLDIVKNRKRIKEAIVRIKDKGIRTSLFIDASKDQVDASCDVGADAIEFHTGPYCHVIEDYFYRFGNYDFESHSTILKRVLKKRDELKRASLHAQDLGLYVCAGHGLHRFNLAPIVAIPEIIEYNIGHAIIARAIFIGLKEAVNEIMRALKRG